MSAIPTPKQARGRLGAAQRHGHPDREIAELRRELEVANLQAHIQRVVDSAPPLSDNQRETLSLLLRPGQGPGDGCAA